MSVPTEYRSSLKMPSQAAIEGFYAGMSQFWQPVLRCEDLPEGGLVGVELLEEKIALARLNGQLVAMQDLCRHFQAQLSIGEIRAIEGHGKCVSCHYHGWAYDASGQCVDIPQLAPGREIPGSAAVPTYAVREGMGLIWVCLSGEPKFDLPAFPELEDSDYRAAQIVTYDPWDAAAPRVLMGTLDDTHFPWVHEGLLGDRNQAEVPDHKVWREDQYLRVEFVVPQPPNPHAAEENDRIVGQNSFQSYHVGIPNVIRLITEHRPVLDDGGELPGRTIIIWLATSPISYNRTRTFWRLVRDFDTDPANDHVYEEFEDAVRAQDKPMVESQRPWLLPPFWTKMELPLRPADLPLIEYKKWLEELNITVAV